MDDISLKSFLARTYPGKGRSSFGFWDYIFAEGSVEAAILYGKLYSPSFVEVDDLVLLADVVSDHESVSRVRTALRKYGDREAVERQFNLVEIDSILVHGEALGDDEDRLLASMLVEVWEAMLAQRFPRRRFVVRVVEPDETSGGFGILFYQS